MLCSYLTCSSLKVGQNIPHLHKHHTICFHLKKIWVSTRDPTDFGISEIIKGFYKEMKRCPLELFLWAFGFMVVIQIFLYGINLTPWTFSQFHTCTCIVVCPRDVCHSRVTHRKTLRDIFETASAIRGVRCRHNNPEWRIMGHIM